LASKYDLAHMVWPHLVDAAGGRRTLTYEELASSISYKNPVLMSLALDPLYHLCPDKGWPHLTGIVVSKETGRPSKGFRAWADEDIQRKRQEVFDFPWSEVERPFPPGTTALLELPATQLEDFSVPDQFVLVNGRGAYQGALRRDLLRIYGNCCALCDTRHEGLLVASHVIPWAQDSANRRNPRNAILLCRAHDAVFELDFLQIRPDCSVDINRPNGRELGEAVEALLTRGTAARLRISGASGAPDPALLARRLEGGT
jgi:hypothetical protein